LQARGYAERRKDCGTAFCRLLRSLRLWNEATRSLGTGISMGFAEALSDDGSLTGPPLGARPRLWPMTALSGPGHTLPYFIAQLRMATAIAVRDVLLELAATAWIFIASWTRRYLRQFSEYNKEVALPSRQGKSRWYATATFPSNG
jgi:hypothetical protein